MRPRVLVADASAPMRACICGPLEDLGYEVRHAEDALELLEEVLVAELEEDPFAVVVTEVDLEPCSALEILVDLRRRRIPTPFLLLDWDGEELDTPAVPWGATLLPMPDGWPELLHVVRRLVRTPIAAA